MNVRVLAMSDKLNVIGIHAAAIEAAVMQLPAMTPIGTRRRGDRSVHRFPGDLVRIRRALAPFDTYGRITALAGVAALPFPAASNDVDGELALHADEGRRGLTFCWHGLFPQADQEAGEVGRVRRAQGWDGGPRTQEGEPGLFFAVL